MPMSNYLQNRVLQATLQGDVFTWPTSLFIGLHTADPTADTSTALSNEVTGNGYSRVVAVFTEPSITFVSQNNADVTFGPATPGGWSTVRFISIWDSISSGNLLYYGTLSSPVLVNASEFFVVASGSLTLQFTT